MSIPFSFEQCPPLVVQGLAMTTNNERAFDEIPAQWQAVQDSGWLAGAGASNSDVHAVYTGFAHEGVDNEGDYTFLIGRPVGTAHEPATSLGLTTVSVPAGRYAVFAVSRGRPDLVGEAWQRIWALDSADLPRSFICDHERYRADGTIEIFVGVKP